MCFGNFLFFSSLCIFFTHHLFLSFPTFLDPFVRFLIVFLFLCFFSSFFYPWSFFYFHFIPPFVLYLLSISFLLCFLHPYFLLICMLIFLAFFLFFCFDLWRTFTLNDQSFAPWGQNPFRVWLCEATFATCQWLLSSFVVALYSWIF